MTEILENVKAFAAAEDNAKAMTIPPRFLREQPSEKWSLMPKIFLISC